MRTVPYREVSLQEGLPDRDPPAQRHSLDRDPLHRNPPAGQTLPWAETPLDRDPPWTETALDRDRDPPDTDPPGQRPPPDRDPQTETPPDRDFLDRDSPGHVTCGACWDRDPPITLPCRNFVNIRGKYTQPIQSYMFTSFTTKHYRSGTVNSNTVNSKFHLIRSFFEILAGILSFHV